MLDANHRKAYARKTIPQHKYDAEQNLQIHQTAEASHQPAIHALELSTSQPAKRKLHNGNDSDEQYDPTQDRVKHEQNVHYFISIPRLYSKDKLTYNETSEVWNGGNMTYTSILVETRGRVGLVTLNRPQAMNALSHQLMTEVMDALEAFDQDENIGALVITGNEKAFAAGADIKEMADKTMQQMIEADHVAVFGRIRSIQKPVIAAVSGWALGGGCEVALSCDMIVASDSAKFGQPEINIGVIPGAGGTQRLVRAVGKALAMEMILNNRTLTAQEALHYGLVNRVVPVSDYLNVAILLADEIAARAPLAVRVAKRMINHSYESFLQDGLAEEKQAFYNLFNSEDQKEGMQAFIEKRKPEWKGK
jgi:enoyl-CoA hydratase